MHCAISDLFSIGADFRMASAGTRNMLSVSADDVAARLHDLTGAFAKEAAIVSTCNRTEVYCLTSRPEKVAKWLAGGDAGVLFRLNARAAARRAFCVASGIESQIIGETEITGQVKRAAQIARESGASGVFVNRLLEKSLSAAKAVRSETDIGRHSLSYCGLAARAAADIFPSLETLSVLFVGAGGMTRSGAAVFAGRNVKHMTFANRNMDKAGELAQLYGGVCMPLSAVAEMLGEFDVVISSTSSPLPLIGKGAAETALNKRRQPMMFVDLGVPPDIEPAVGELPNAFVYTLSQLGERAQQSQSARHEAAIMAGTIIDRHVDDFCLWWDKHAARNSVKAEDFRQQETEAALERLHRGEDARQVMEHFSRRLSSGDDDK